MVFTFSHFKFKTHLSRIVKYCKLIKDVDDDNNTNTGNIFVWFDNTAMNDSVA